MELFNGLKIEICKYLTYVDYMKLVKADKSYKVLDRDEIYDLFTGNKKLNILSIGSKAHKNCIECRHKFEEDLDFEYLTLDEFLLNFGDDFHNNKGFFVMELFYDGVYFSRDDNFNHKIIKLYTMTNLKKFYNFIKKY